MRTLDFLLLIILIPISIYAQWVYDTVLIQPKAPIVIDGDLSDWRGLDVKAQPMENFITGIKGLQKPSGKEDLSGDFRCVVDPDNIYVAIRVRDDKIIFGEEEFGLYWHDDSVEIYLDGDLVPPSEKKEIPNPDLIPWDYDVNDAQIRISMDQARNIVMDGASLFDQRLVQLPGLWESLGVVAAIKENSSGYTVEVKIPQQAFIPILLEKGSQIGFGVMVYDDDDGGRADSKISWTQDPDSISWKSTRHLGRLRIQRVQIER